MLTIRGTCVLNLRSLFIAIVATLFSLAGKGSSLAAEASASNPDSQQMAQSTSAPSPQAAPATQSEAVPASDTVKPRKLKCQHPANPNKRRFGCKNEDYDWEETLAGDWAGSRAEGKKLGISASGSYYSVLQSNLTGKQHQMWGYVGQLTTAVDFDFDKLLKIPGMSLYFSDSWGTGSNLTAAIGSVFPGESKLWCRGLSRRNLSTAEVVAREPYRR